MTDKETERSSRIAVIRDAATLQIKLVVDGMRDAILIPVSLIAAVVGILRGGDDPGREFRNVIDLGRKTERWINLFGRYTEMDVQHPAGTIDKVLEQAEAAVVEQYKKGRPPASGKSAGSPDRSGPAEIESSESDAPGPEKKSGQ